MSIIAIDQGTTGTTTILYNKFGIPVIRAYREFNQYYPKPGWVEHDPQEIWQTVTDTIHEIMAHNPGKIDAVGITNQRETTLLWDRETGQEVYNAIVWQCRRTSGMCDKLRPHEKVIREKTGLPLDPYFSATKIRWILENVPELPPINQVAFGTVDSWLIWQLTSGKSHATDFTNASRSLLFDIEEQEWSGELCEIFEIPPQILPQVRASLADYGRITSIPELEGVPILGVAGDQQAALFGQTCFYPGEAKNTYGTGCFLLMNTGRDRVVSKNNLLSTIAIDDAGNPCHALEGAVFVGGAAIQWLRDELCIIENAADSEAVAMSLNGNDGVYFVPAFVGLGAPHWKPNARGILTGLTRGTNQSHIVRAALEAMAYQSLDLINAMEEDTNTIIPALHVDGGAIANNFLSQFQADILDKQLIRPAVIESTSRGAAYLAGLNAGIWRDARELRTLESDAETFSPKMSSRQREELIEGWRHAIQQALTI